MAQNRGKQFEEKVRRAFELTLGTSVTRLIDPPRGYKGVHNPCDFIVYNYPVQYMIECKCHYGNTLPFSAISQFDSLVELDTKKGIVAGVLVWFIDHDRTIFIPAHILNAMRKRNMKSVNVKTLDDTVGSGCYVNVYGKKKRVFFEYRMKDFFNEITTKHIKWFLEGDKYL